MTWTREAPGCYTSALGGICREKRGWVFSARRENTLQRRFPTLAAAKRWAETCANRKKGS